MSNIDTIGEIRQMISSFKYTQPRSETDIRTLVNLLAVIEHATIADIENVFSPAQCAYRYLLHELVREYACSVAKFKIISRMAASIIWPSMIILWKISYTHCRIHIYTYDHANGWCSKMIGPTGIPACKMHREQLAEALTQLAGHLPGPLVTIAVDYVAPGYVSVVRAISNSKSTA